MPILEIPLCQTCLEEDGHECRVCKKWVCWNCCTIVMTGPDTEECFHVKPSTKSNPNWNQNDKR